VLAGLALGVTVTNGFARFAYGLLLPAMKSEMGWTYAQAGWLNTANALGYIGGAVLTMLLIRRVPPTRLFAIGMVTTTLALLATGLNAALGWQTFWRIAAGVLGAMSFSTAGTLAAGLFQGDPRRSALAIAILFGSGVGLGIVLAGAALPLMLHAWGPASWPMGWMVIHGCRPLITRAPALRSSPPGRSAWNRPIDVVPPSAPIRSTAEVHASGGVGFEDHVHAFDRPRQLCGYGAGDGLRLRGAR
jgi:MFS family permease